LVKFFLANKNTMGLLLLVFPYAIHFLQKQKLKLTLYVDNNNIWSNGDEYSKKGHFAIT
jgi:hypothetical protein